MVANAGTIEAQLILNASQFQKQMQAAMASAQSATKGMATGSQAIIQGMNNATKSVQTYTNSVKGAATQATYMGQAIGGTVNQLSGMNKAVSTATSSFSNMGNAYKTAITPISSTTSTISSALSSVGNTGAAAFGKVGSGIMTAGNALGSFANSLVSFNVWLGALVGAAFYQFTIGSAMAVQEAKSLFQFVGMSADEVERLDQSTAKYAESASKVSQPEMLSGWRLIRLSHKLSADEMTKYNGVLGDTIGLFKANGRTAEDAGRAIEDAMAGGSDGIKRLKEIGISDMQELYDRGFDPSKPETFFAALQKLYQDKGIEGYGSKVTSLSDRFENLKEKIQLAGIAAGEALMPAMEGFVNGLTAVFEGLGPQISGIIIAFTGLSVILGFFWPTLVTIGAGLTAVAGKMLAAAGATAVYGTAIKGTNGQTVGLLQSLKSIPMATIAAAAGIAAMIAALVGLAYYISQTMSATIAWNNAEKQKKATVDGLNAQNKTLQSNVENLTRARQIEANAGRSTVDIDREIAETRAQITSNTQAAANAEVAWTNAQTMRQNLESLGQSKTSSAKTAAAAAQLGISPEDYVKLTGTTAEYNDELQKTAQLNANIYTVYGREASTIDRINKGTDTYSRIMKANANVFREYKQDYDDYAKSSEAFWLALDKGDIGGMIKEGVMSAFFQFKVALVEAKVSIMSWAEETGNAIKKPFQEVYVSIVTPINNAINYVKNKWNEFWAGLGETGVITELKGVFVEVEGAVIALGDAFNSVQSELSGLWGELTNAFNEVKSALADVWSELSGPLNEIKSAFSDVLSELSEPINDLMNAFKELIWPVKDVKTTIDDVPKDEKPWLTLKDIIKGVADGIRAAIPKIRLFADGIRWGAERVRELGEFVRGVAESVGWMAAQFSISMAYIRGAWSNTVAWFQSGLSWISSGFSGMAAWIQGAWNNTMAFFGNIANAAIGGVLGLWNTLVGAVGSGVYGVVSVGENGLSWAYNTVRSLWAMVAGGVSGVVSIITKISQGPPMGPSYGPPNPSLKNASSNFLNMASGFKYLAYGGIGQSIGQTFSSCAGNCVDGSLAQIALAKSWGIPAELIQTTWMGNPHVYARIAGQDRDIANHALTGSWRAPPRGPRGSGGGNIIIQGDVYGYNDFVKKVEQANNKLVKRY